MLRSFHVKNWRDFNSLSIQGLSRVNLIVGPHGVGKTALLEAIWLYHQRFVSAEVHRLLAARDEHHLGFEALPTPPLRLEALLHRRGAGERSLVLWSEVGTLTAHLLLSDEVLTRWNTGAFADLDALCHQVAQHGEPTRRWQVRWEPAQDAASTPLLFPPELPAPAPAPIQGDLFSPPTSSLQKLAPGAFLHPDLLASSSLPPAAWDALTQPPHGAEVLRSLQRLAPRIKRLGFAHTAHRTLPLVSLAGDLALELPLRSFGDGAAQLLTLHCALVHSRNGVLLLDGFERHFSAELQAYLWPMIQARAAALNVQVFAVINSPEDALTCAAASEQREEVSLIRLSKARGVHRAERSVAR